MYGIGEVELRSSGLYIKLPTSHPIEKLESDCFMEALGIASCNEIIGEGVVFPFNLIERANIEVKSYGSLAERAFIRLSFKCGSLRFQVSFAPFKGRIKRKFLSQEFYTELLSFIKLKR